MVRGLSRVLTGAGLVVLGSFTASVLPDFSTAPIVKDVPIGNFHGEADDVEPVAASRRMIEAVRKVGGRPLYTEYPGVGHPSFAWAYTEPALVEWLFARHR